MKKQHYLITIQVPPKKTNFHGYLMIKSKHNDRYKLHAVDKMMEILEQHDAARLAMPVVFVTDLDTGVGLVQEIVSKNSEEAGRLISEATDYHFSAFFMQDGCSDDEKLMELH